jgi:hypothetical protein
LLVLLALVQQGSFLADPFAPLLGFAGLGFVLFGVIWGFLTSGGHSSARGRAGISRSVIMLAYAVVPTALLAYLGVPLVLAMLAAWLPVALGLGRGPTARPGPIPVATPVPA